MVRDLTLFVDDHWISPYAFSNFVALREKGLAFDVEEVSLPKKEHQTSEYLAKSLTGRVPVLRHGDFWLSESAAINEYLAEAFAAPKYPRLYPEDLKDRARARQLMDWIRSDLMPIREERPTSSLFYARPVKPLSAKAKADAARLMQVAEQLIQEGRYTLFDRWCIADADFSLMLNRLVLHGYPTSEKVDLYIDANWERASVKEWESHQRKDFVDY